MKHSQLMEAAEQKAAMLVERWAGIDGDNLRGYKGQGNLNFMEGIEDPHVQKVAAQVLENTRQAMLREDTQTSNVGSFEKFVFPVIRSVMANLLATELVSVQPLDGPTGLIFYFHAIYGSQKGDIQQGTKAYHALTGPSSDYHYSDETVPEETLGTGNGATAKYTGNLSWTPVRPGTIEITDGAQTVTDDGQGNLVGDVDGGGDNTINYATGAYDVTFAADVGNGDTISATYQFDSEAHTGVPQVELLLESSPVVARTHKLRARWSMEAAQDLKAYHGEDAEVQLVQFMSNLIQKEINYKIVRNLRQIAAAGSVAWDQTAPTGVAYVDHKESFYGTLIEASNLIYAATQRIYGSWIWMGLGAANVVETLDKFVPAGDMTPPSGSGGPVYMGTLGGYKCYKDPAYPTNEFLVGAKGNGFLDAGYVYAPYIPLYATDTYMFDDFVARKGLSSRVALKAIDSGYYCTGSITQSS